MQNDPLAINLEYKSYNNMVYFVGLSNVQMLFVALTWMIYGVMTVSGRLLPNTEMEQNVEPEMDDNIKYSTIMEQDVRLVRLEKILLTIASKIFGRYRKYGYLF